MRLFFDIGNTRLKWALDLQGSVVKSGSILYKQQSLAALDQLSEVGQVVSVWASSVASNDVESQIDVWVKEKFDLTVDWLSVGEKVCGVKNTYQPLTQLGVDRWAAVLGAKQYLLANDLSGSAAIIIDAGTAVTVDVLTNDFVYQGGAIFPGLNMMHGALIGSTQGIDSSLVDDLVVPGKNTQQCVSGGVYYALFGAIERLVAEMQNRLGSSVVVLTGGDALLIERYSSLKFIVLPNLVIDGLRCVAESSENS